MVKHWQRNHILVTIDGYWFVIRPGTILNTFDFVTVNNFKSKTIGLVQDIRALPSIVRNNGISDEVVDYGEKNNISKTATSAIHIIY